MHFIVMERDDNGQFPPAGVLARLSTWRAASSEPPLAAQFAAGMDMDALVAALSHALSASRKREANWLQKLMAGNSSELVSAQVVVESFVEFLAMTKDLSATVLGTL